MHLGLFHWSSSISIVLWQIRECFVGSSSTSKRIEISRSKSSSTKSIRQSLSDARQKVGLHSNFPLNIRHFSIHKVSGKRRTRYVQMSSEPEWNQLLEYGLSPQALRTMMLEFSVWDYDKDTDNLPLGKVTLNLAGKEKLLSRNFIALSRKINESETRTNQSEIAKIRETKMNFRYRRFFSLNWKWIYKLCKLSELSGLRRTKRNFVRPGRNSNFEFKVPF